MLLSSHSLAQEKMKREVVVLQRLLEAKERRMMDLLHSGGQVVPSLKQHYDKKLAELEGERDQLVAERGALMTVRTRQQVTLSILENFEYFQYPEESFDFGVGAGQRASWWRRGRRS